MQALQTASPRPFTALKQTPGAQEAHTLLSTYTHAHILLTRTPRSITRNPGPGLMMGHTRNFTSLHQRCSSGSILYVRVPRGHKNTAPQDRGVHQATGMISELRSPPPSLFPRPSLKGERTGISALRSPPWKIAAQGSGSSVASTREGENQAVSARESADTGLRPGPAAFSRCCAAKSRDGVTTASPAPRSLTLPRRRRR